MEKLSFRVAEFEGPLDLLLHLLSNHKLNIQDIEIFSLFEQYMDYIRSLKERNLEVTSEFLEMASRLIYIKTVSLLPRYEEETEKAKRELIGQLLEYQACKEAAAMLAGRATGFEVFVRVSMEIEMDPTYTLTHRPVELLAAYGDAVGKGKRRLPPESHVFTPLVARPVVSVNGRIMHILRRLYHGAQLKLGKLFAESAGDRSLVVATFLAVLELIKAKRISVEGSEDNIRFHGENRRKT